MKKLLIIGAGIGQINIIQKAKKMGLDVYKRQMSYGFRDLVLNLHLTELIRIFLITAEESLKITVTLKTVLLSECMKVRAVWSM